jgi:DME family drug/metabolite transporter
MLTHAAALFSARSRATARRTRSLSGPGAILAAAALWGTTGTVSTLAPHGAQPAAVGSAGLAAGGLLLWSASRRTRPGPAPRPRPAARTGSQRWLLGLGALAVAGYPVTFYPAVARTGVAVATVIALGSAPAFAGLLAWAAGQGRPARRWAAATAAAVLGCAVLVLAPALAGHGRVDGAGVLLAALAGLCYACYSLAARALIAAGQPAGRVLGSMFGMAGLAVLPVLLACGAGWLATWRGAAVAAHLAVCTTFLAYRLFGRGLRGTSAQVATTLTLAEPAVATLLGVAVLGERLPALSWGGLAVLAAGLACLAAPVRQRSQATRRRPGPWRPGRGYASRSSGDGRPARSGDGGARKPRSSAAVPSRCSATARRARAASPARIASAIAVCWRAVWSMLCRSTGIAFSRSFSRILASVHAAVSRLDPVSSAIARWNRVSSRR